ncbi:MAG: septal ring lytic transglycosylase RlpA family protein [Hydrogenophaga sp.]|nr:septal ring lytic transglycosylase RlpA family protein [Hydrogenophaga sp.]
MNLPANAIEQPDCQRAPSAAARAITLLALLLVTVLWLGGCASPPRHGSSTSAPEGREIERGVASWYGAQHHGRRTASGEVFDMNAFTAAHKTLPFGTRVRVFNPASGQAVVVRINDRGPFTPGRVIDLSRAGAERIGLIRAGVAPVVIYAE